MFSRQLFRRGVGLASRLFVDRGRGFLDLIDRDHVVHGWAYFPRNPSRTARVEICLDGEVIGQVDAGMLRRDLVEKNVGLGRHGFTFDLTPSLNGSQTRGLVTARIVGGAPLQRSLVLRERRQRKSAHPHRLVKRQGLSQRIIQHEKRLWAGFASAMLPVLEDIVRRSQENPRARYSAAWVLARFQASRGHLLQSLDYLAFMGIVSSAHGLFHANTEKLARTLEIDLLLKLGRFADAKSVLEQAIMDLGKKPEFWFCRSNVDFFAPRDPLNVSQRRLHFINQAFVKGGFAEIELVDSIAGLTIDNIQGAKSVVAERSGEAKISVLMPAFNGAQTIEMAAMSVLRQTWRNLELIIVDDASSDETWEKALSLAAHDHRVRLVRQVRNRGAYCARNAAFRLSDGDYVTVHDTDDWSHPQLLERQVCDLLRSGAPVNGTNGIRVSSELLMLSKRRHANQIFLNTSSLMFRRDAIARLGGWDDARVSADSELYHRVQIAFGASSRILHRDIPLSFLLTRPEALTRAGPTSIESIHFGARREYTEAYLHWHAGSGPSPEGLVIKREPRSFPAPAICRPERPAHLRYDVIYATDCASPEPSQGMLIDMWTLGGQLGLRQALIHWPELENADKAFAASIREKVNATAADVLVTGECAAATLAIVIKPSVLLNLPENLPKVSVEFGILVAGEHDQQLNLAALETNFENAFGIRPEKAMNWSKAREFVESAGVRKTLAYSERG